MTTNVATVLFLVALGLAIESTIVSDVISGQVCTLSDPETKLPPPPQQ